MMIIPSTVSCHGNTHKKISYKGSLLSSSMGADQTLGNNWYSKNITLEDSIIRDNTAIRGQYSN